MTRYVGEILSNGILAVIPIITRWSISQSAGSHNRRRDENCREAFQLPRLQCKLPAFDKTSVHTQCLRYSSNAGFCNIETDRALSRCATRVKGFGLSEEAWQHSLVVYPSPLDRDLSIGPFQLQKNVQHDIQMQRREPT
ncbi:unnamed protein product [Ixodes pacificus]